jgi:hypothetical protein
MVKVANVAMLKVQAIMHDGSVGLEFMTDDATQAEEMRTQCPAFDCVAGVSVFDETGWVRV